MKELTGDKILIIPDIHQCVGFASDALQTEFNYVIFLGDYFDCFENSDGKNYLSIQQTCEWLNETKIRLGDKAVWLIGNHDVSYMSVFSKKAYVPRNISYYCTGWTRSKAKQINKYLDPSFFTNLKLCCFANNYCCSHAGFNYNHFKPYKSEKENIQELADRWENDKTSFHLSNNHWIWNVGRSRGGIDSVGSPVWLDWNDEFSPIDNISQIVGHSSYFDPHFKLILNKGNNWNIDRYRTLSVLLQQQKLIFKSFES